MNEECKTCVKRKTQYCPNSSECLDTIDKPYYQNRIMLLEENKQLKEQLQNISNEFLKYDWKTSNKEQIINQLESLYNSIFRE